MLDSLPTRHSMPMTSPATSRCGRRPTGRNWHASPTGDAVTGHLYCPEPWRLRGISPQGDQAVLHVDVGLGSEGVLITDLAVGDSAIRLPLLNIRAIGVSSAWRTLAIADVAEV